MRPKLQWTIYMLLAAGLLIGGSVLVFMHDSTDLYNYNWQVYEPSEASLRINDSVFAIVCLAAFAYWRQKSNSGCSRWRYVILGLIGYTYVNSEHNVLSVLTNASNGFGANTGWNPYAVDDHSYPLSENEARMLFISLFCIFIRLPLFCNVHICR